MKVRHMLAVGLLGLGFAAAPLLPSAQAADDTPAKKPADGGGRGQRGGAGFVERYHDAVMKLNLTDEQKTKLEPAFKDAKEKIEAAVKDAGGDRKAAGEKIRPIMENLRKTVDDTLTQEQKDQLKKDMPQHGGRRGPGGNGNNGGDKPKQ